jgi:hypothetical protein
MLTLHRGYGVLAQAQKTAKIDSAAMASVAELRRWVAFWSDAAQPPLLTARQAAAVADLDVLEPLLRRTGVTPAASVWHEAGYIAWRVICTVLSQAGRHTRLRSRSVCRLSAALTRRMGFPGASDAAVQRWLTRHPEWEVSLLFASDWVDPGVA